MSIQGRGLKLNLRLFWPNVVLTVQEYRGFQPKSQYITLRNADIIFLIIRHIFCETIMLPLVDASANMISIVRCKKSIRLP